MHLLSSLLHLVSLLLFLVLCYLPFVLLLLRTCSYQSIVKRVLVLSGFESENHHPHPYDAVGGFVKRQVPGPQYPLWDPRHISGNGRACTCTCTSLRTTRCVCRDKGRERRTPPLFSSSSPPPSPINLLFFLALLLLLHSPFGIFRLFALLIPP